MATKWSTTSWSLHLQHQVDSPVINTFIESHLKILTTFLLHVHLQTAYIFAPILRKESKIGNLNLIISGHIFAWYNFSIKDRLSNVILSKHFL